MAGPAAKDVIAGRYRLVYELGRGGMGTVWQAQDDRLNRSVAVKLMARRLLMDKTAVDRFEREAKAVARLLSPHIVQIYDYGVDPQPFMVMELLQGENLSQRLAREGQLPIDEVATLMRQSARGLATAHDAGIVHRDLKPGNLFIVKDRDTEYVKVVDFGIAKAVRRQATLTAITTHNQPVGTPQYMSPDQLRAKEDHRDDVWSLAVIAYKALCGVHPFASDSLVTLVQRIMDEPHVRPRDYEPALPPGIDAVFDRAFTKDREGRYQSAPDFADALDALLTRPPASAPFEVLDVSDEMAATTPLRRDSSPSAVAAPLTPGGGPTPTPTGPLSLSLHPPVEAVVTSAALPTPAPVAPPPRVVAASVPNIDDDEPSTGEVTLVRTSARPPSVEPTLVDSDPGAMTAASSFSSFSSLTPLPSVDALNVPTPTPPPAAATAWPAATLPPQRPALGPIAIGVGLAVVALVVGAFIVLSPAAPSDDATTASTAHHEAPAHREAPAATDPPDDQPPTEPGAPEPLQSSAPAPEPASSNTPLAPPAPNPPSTAKGGTAPLPPPTPAPPRRRKRGTPGDELFNDGPF